MAEFLGGFIKIFSLALIVGCIWLSGYLLGASQTNAHWRDVVSPERGAAAARVGYERGLEACDVNHSAKGVVQ